MYIEPIYPVQPMPDYSETVMEYFPQSKLLLLVVIIPSNCEFVNHDITEIHQVIQALFQSIVNCGALCRSRTLDQTILKTHRHQMKYHRFECAHSSSLLTDVVSSIHKTPPRDYTKFLARAELQSLASAYFFIIIYLKALPRV